MGRIDWGNLFLPLHKKFGQIGVIHMATEKKTVDWYIDSLEGDWRSEVIVRLRKIILEAAPNATESIKWAQPVYEEGGPFAFIKAFKNHVNFGFWRGLSLTDPDGLIEGSGAKMGHVKIKSPEDIREEEFTVFVLETVRLNHELGNPATTRK
jgi:hypothetical protein